MKSYFGIKVKQAVISPEVEARIREIVREELAARREQPVGGSTYLSKDHEHLCEIGISTPV